MAHNTDHHDFIIVGNQAQNTIEGDVADDLAEPAHRNDLDLLYRMNPKP